jgi:glyoxylase-like metal-dependent hydrolase (beta-lactamase superfamily II)
MANPLCHREEAAGRRGDLKGKKSIVHNLKTIPYKEKRMNGKKRLTIIISILAAALLISGYMYFSHNHETVDLPDGVKVIPLEFTNVFLIPLEKGYMLIDNGYAKEYDRFLQGLKHHGVDVMDIGYVFITHHHDDHVGFLNTLTVLNKSVRVIVHETGVPLLAAGENNTKNGGGIVNRAIYALFRLKMLITPTWDFSFPPYRVRKQDIVLKGEKASLPKEVGLSATVLHTPGHSSDSISLIYNDRYLFGGDMASSFLLWAGAKYLTLFNENVGQVYASWEKALSTNIEFILPAHGKPFKAERLKENLHKYSQDDLVAYF